MKSNHDDCGTTIVYSQITQMNPTTQIMLTIIPDLHESRNGSTANVRKIDITMIIFIEKMPYL